MAIAVFSHALEATGQIDRFNAESGIPINFVRASKGPVHLSFDGCQSDALSLWTTRSHHGFLSTPTNSADIFTLRFVTSGAIMRRNKRGDEHLGTPNRAMFVAFQDMREERASVEFSALAATVTRRTLLTACEALEGDAPDRMARFAPLVDVVGPGLLALQRTLHALDRKLRAQGSAGDFLLALLEEILIYQLVGAWPTIEGGSESMPPAPTAQALRHAIDYMEANLSRKLSIAEIASAAGLGVRALQIAFKRDVGCTPIEFLINRRLDRVHDALLASGGHVAVAQIAAQWGFVHMGDFSRRYRLRFGHPPRDTILR